MSIFDQALTRTDGKTLILTNGSKWAGDTPDDIQVLLEVLAKDVLDPSFEQYHCYEPVPFDPLLKERGEESARKYLPWVGAATFSGNFLTVSHVFHIITQDQQVIETLQEAIRRNLEKPEYQRHAYELYADWYYAETAHGKRLVSPTQAEDIRSGNISRLRYPRNFEEMKSAKLIGPRFVKQPEAQCA